MFPILNRYRLVFLLVIELMVASNVKWGRDRWKQVIAFDGKGYYAYLPAIFIYDDLQFSFHDSVETNYSSTHTYFDFRQPSGNGIVNKYFAGTSIALLPFFLIAHAITNLTGGLADGYSYYYQIAVSLAAIIYSLIGFLLLGKLLRYYQIRENIITITILSICLATPLFYYIVFEPSMSHVYSFTFITAFLYLLKKFTANPRNNYIIYLAVIYGMIILLRPVNGLIIFIIPFITGSFENLKVFFWEIRQRIPALLMALLLFTIIISIQPMIYHYQTGSYFTYSYGKETIIWSRPEIINILFSYRKGLFIYAPLLFISIFGLIPIYRKNKFQFFSITLFSLLICYVLSCWWIWWYGGGFGFRPLVEYYSLFAVLLGILLMNITKPITKIILTVSVLFCFLLCQIQIYQYRYFFLHWEKMDKEHYWRIFLRVDQLAKKDIDGNPNRDLLDERE